MANDHDDPTDTGQENPLARPRFLVAGVVVLLIVALGGVLIIRNAQSRDVAEQLPVESSRPSITAPPPSSTSATGSSVCGLDEPRIQKPVTKAPAVGWEYDGTIAYPTSPEYGPGEKAPEGYRYCFQHSADGALIMAANAVVQGSNPKTGSSWAEYALGDGPYKDQLSEEIGSASGADGTRMKVVGYRILDFTGQAARVDLGINVSSQNEVLFVSAVYELKWQDGDWKLSADVPNPLDIATIPDVAAYIPWGSE